MNPDFDGAATCRRRPRALLALGALLILLVLGTRSASADACSSCAAPSLARLSKEPGFSLVERYGRPDYYEVDGGECTATLTEPPDVTRTRSWLILRGSGAVWSCPSGTAKATFQVEVAESDVREWSLSSNVSLAGEVLGVGLSASITQQVRSAMTFSTTTTLTQELSAGYCRTIRWGAYFEVAELATNVDVKLERRWAWWTKHVYTGDTVHKHGDAYVVCGTTTASLDARAPLNGHFRLYEQICADPECAGLVGRGDLGFVAPASSLPLVDPIDPSASGLPVEEPEAAPDEDPDADEDADPDPDANPGADPEADPDADPEANAEPEADADAEAGADPEEHPDDPLADEEPPETPPTVEDDS